jgi:hypothetical protein
MSRTRGVLQGDQESAGMWRVVAVVATGPCIDVNATVRRDNQLACMANTVSEYCDAKASRNTNSLSSRERARLCVCEPMGMPSMLRREFHL